MSRMIRRVSALAATTVVAGTLLPLLPAAPVQAVDVPTENLVVQSDEVGLDSLWGYYKRPPGSGTNTTLVSESTSYFRHGLDVSRDGSRFIYVQDSYNADDEFTGTKVIVRDISGNLVRVVQDLPASSPHYPQSPILSPDGTVAAWTDENYSFGEEPVLTIRRANVAAGNPVTISGSTTYGAGTFLDADTLAVGDATSEKTLPLTGGTPTAIVGDFEPSYDFIVSPDGTQIAWTHDTSAPDADISTTSIQVATLSLSGDVATFGAPVTLASGLMNRSPAWSRDGSTVYFVRRDNDAHPEQAPGLFGNGDVWKAPADASSAAVVDAETAGDEISVGMAAQDSTAPEVPTAQPFQANGTTATLHWTNPSDADLSGVRITRTDTSNSTSVVRFVPAPLTAVVDTGLVVGHTYSYAFAGVDRSGNVGLADTRLMTAMGGPAVISDPTSRTTTKAPFLVRFGGSTPNNVLYTVTYGINGGGARSWVTARPGAARTFGSAATTGVAATTSVPGQTYRFTVSAVDGYGNTFGPALSIPAVVPFDQTRASLSGGANVARSDGWLGTVRRLNATTHYARIAITGSRFQVIGERCPTCGVVDIYDGNTRVASVDTRAASRQARQVLYTRTWSSVGNHTLTLRPRATAGRPYVYLDGFGVRR